MSPTGPRCSGIYVIRNIANGKYYIGSAQVIHKRWIAHWCALQRGDHRNPRLQRAWKKYGPESFVFEVAEFCGVADLLAKEQALLDARNGSCCYNISPNAGICRGIKRTTEQRRRASEVLLGHSRATQENRESARQRLAGNKYWVGRCHTAESKEKMRVTHKRRWEDRPVLPKFRPDGACAKGSPEYCEKLRSANLGKRHSPETRRKCAASARNRRHSQATKDAMTGRKLPLETREKMRISQALRRERERRCQM